MITEMIHEICGSDKELTILGKTIVVHFISGDPLVIYNIGAKESYLVLFRKVFTGLRRSANNLQGL